MTKHERQKMRLQLEALTKFFPLPPTREERIAIVLGELITVDDLLIICRMHLRGGWLEPPDDRELQAVVVYLSAIEKAAKQVGRISRRCKTQSNLRETTAHACTGPQQTEGEHSMKRQLSEEEWEILRRMSLERPPLRRRTRSSSSS